MGRSMVVLEEYFWDIFTTPQSGFFLLYEATNPYGLEDVGGQRIEISGE